MLYRRCLIAAVPVVLVLALPGAAEAQGIVPGKRKVRRLYKRLTSRPNLGGGRELVFKRGRYRLIFAAARGRVYRISGGRAPWALWQECV